MGEESGYMCVCLCVLSALTPYTTEDTFLQTQEHLMRFKRRGKKKQILSDLSEISRQLHTFGRASSYDDDDDEDNKCQEQEGGEDVAQRQEKVVPLLGQDDGDDSR